LSTAEAVDARVLIASLPSQVNVDTRQVADYSRQLQLLRATIER
jgi:hypothetical protein